MGVAVLADRAGEAGAVDPNERARVHDGSPGFERFRPTAYGRAVGRLQRPPRRYRTITQPYMLASKKCRVMAQITR